MARFQNHYCQPFGNGVFISYTKGKAGFYDGNLNLVKQTDYALAEPFYKHLAKVCIERPQKKKLGNELFAWVGGKCGYIGEDYEVVLPAIHAYEATAFPAAPF